jgi:hypothetical protein
MVDLLEVQGDTAIPKRNSQNVGYAVVRMRSRMAVIQGWAVENKCELWGPAVLN